MSDLHQIQTKLLSKSLQICLLQVNKSDLNYIFLIKIRLKPNKTKPHLTYFHAIRKVKVMKVKVNLPNAMSGATSDVLNPDIGITLA